MLYRFLILLFSSFSIALFSQQKIKNYDHILKSKNIYELDAFLRDAHVDDPRRTVIKPRLMDMLTLYIKNAHPEDQRVSDMQEKLALLKRRPSTKITFEEMNAKIKEKQIKFYQEELERLKIVAATPKKNNTKDLKNTTREHHKTSDISQSKKPSIFDTKITKTNTENSSKTSNTKSSNAISLSEKEEFDMLMNPSSEEHKNKTVKVLNALFDNDPNSKETTVLIENQSDCDIIMRIEGTGYIKFRLAIPAKGQNTIVIPKGQYLFSSLVCGAQYASQKSILKSIMVSLGNPSP